MRTLNLIFRLFSSLYQLYLIWLGDAALNEDEASIGGTLGAVALRSGGEIFRITEEPLPNGEVGLVSAYTQFSLILLIVHPSNALL